MSRAGRVQCCCEALRARAYEIFIFGEEVALKGRPTNAVPSHEGERMASTKRRGLHLTPIAIAHRKGEACGMLRTAVAKQYIKVFVVVVGLPVPFYSVSASVAISRPERCLEILHYCNSRQERCERNRRPLVLHLIPDIASGDHRIIF